MKYGGFRLELLWLKVSFFPSYFSDLINHKDTEVMTFFILHQYLPTLPIVIELTVCHGTVTQVAIPFGTMRVKCTFLVFTNINAVHTTKHTLILH